MIRLKKPDGSYLSINEEEHPLGRKIAEGFDYDFVNGELVVRETKSGATKWAKAKSAEVATLGEIRTLLAEHLKRCNCEGL